jgi:hypothetical protein
MAGAAIAVACDEKRVGVGEVTCVRQFAPPRRRGASVASKTKNQIPPLHLSVAATHGTQSRLSAVHPRICKFLRNCITLGRLLAIKNSDHSARFMSAESAASSSDAAAAQQRRRQQLETQIAIDELRSLKPTIGGGAGSAGRPPAVYEQRSNGVLFLSSQREMLAKKTGANQLLRVGPLHRLSDILYHSPNRVFPFVVEHIQCPGG